jgi:hypothetical protein
MNKFTKEFKEKAIQLQKEGIHPNEIFKNTGISIKDKQKDYASKLINRWIGNKEIKRKLNSEEALLLKNIKKKEENKKIEYLEAQVTYLKAENDFLANLPKKKRN